MKLTEHIYKLTGVEYETNSNIYGIAWDGGIALIDCGYQEDQWRRMTEVLREWNFSEKDITDVFLTHSHFDHAGNVWRVNQLGAAVHASAEDKERIENGNPEMEELFHSTWICGTVDDILEDGQVYRLDAHTSITALRTPGHSRGSFSFLIEADGIRALANGDMFFIAPRAPEDAVSVDLAYQGSSDFSLDDSISSVRRLKETGCDLYLPGHYYTYRGEHVREIFESALRKLEAERKTKRNTVE